jgi:hypothetical protein
MSIVCSAGACIAHLLMSRLTWSLRMSCNRGLSGSYGSSTEAQELTA